MEIIQPTPENGDSHSENRVEPEDKNGVYTHKMPEIKK